MRNGALTLAVGLTLLGLFAPWVQSGSSTRSSFELLDLAQRLGFTQGGAFEWAVRLWPFVPLAMMSAVVAVWFARSNIGALLGAACGVYVLAIAVAVINAPDSGLIGIEWGVGVSMAGGLALLAASCWMGAASRST
jgi:hypothetical protein